MTPTRLMVWLTLPDGARLHAGDLAFSPVSAGRYQAAFRYTRDFLADERSFPLDPLNLPLSREEHHADQLGPPLGVVHDALPDAWGRRLIALRGQQEHRQYEEPDMLLLRNGLGLGALDFTLPGERPGTPSFAKLVQVSDLVDAVERLERGEDIEEYLSLLLQGGTSPGGARPKALVVDDAGRHWLAKFPLVGDPFDMVGLEYAAMRTAGRAGLDVPEVELFPVHQGRRALLVERFDVTPANGRWHDISLSAVMGERPGVYITHYRQVMDALREAITQDVQRELGVFYRQAVFNAVIGNTDEHLKNFMLLHDDSGYRLSPAYDLLPNVGERYEHALRFGLEGTMPTRATLRALGAGLGQDVDAVIDEVIDRVRSFPVEAEVAGVPPEQVARFDKDMTRRQERLGKVPDTSQRVRI